MPEAVAEHPQLTPTELASVLGELASPRVFRGLVADWPLVRAARESRDAASQLIASFDVGAVVQANVAPPEAAGRFFYDETLTGFNFQPERGTFSTVLATLERLAKVPNPPSVYVGSTTLSTALPGFETQHPMPGVPAHALASIWLGNRSRIAAHHDAPDNLACVAVGRRRFTLFPPEQVGNLYVGPIDFTPAGQAISLVDFAEPDFHRFPRFADALNAAQVVELEPGDALFIPSLWWHQVEGLEALNVLVNYWWNTAPPWADPPMNALMHGLLAMRGLPPRQRAAWAALFQHYVFAEDDAAVAHIPDHARRVLGRLDEKRAADLREKLRQRLQR